MNIITKNIITPALLTACVWLSTGPAWSAVDGASSPAVCHHDDVTKPSTVVQFTLPDVVQGRYDVQVTLYMRNNTVSMGYAQVPERDNMVHRVDAQPSAPIAFVWAKDGKEINVPESARGSYSYKEKNFLKYKELYNKGEVDIIHTDEVPPVTLRDGKLSGMMDIKINQVDAVNLPSRTHNSLVYRTRIDAKVQRDQVSGEAVFWSYASKDDDYGKGNQQTTVPFTGAILNDYWKKNTANTYAKGKDWPMAYGPNLTGAAIDSDQPLVKTLHDARLLWVADMPIGSGRGGGLTRGQFAMFPHSWNTLWSSGFGGPTLADDKVFLYAPQPDLEAIKRDPKLARNPYYRLGAEPGHFANDLGHHRECVMAFDAQTGTVLWQYLGQPGNVTGSDGKGGRASSPCYYQGQLFVRMSGQIICLDAESGEKIWSVGGFGLKGAPGDASVTQIGGTLIVTRSMKGGWQTVGLSPKDGSTIWSHDFVGGGGSKHAFPGNSIPGLYREKDKEYAVMGRSSPIEKFKYEKEGIPVPPATFLMIDPVDGRILWESDALAYNDSQIVVVGDIAIGNYMEQPTKKMKHPQETHRIAGVQISTKGAKRIWTQPAVHPSKYRQMSIAHHGMYFSDSRKTRFTATDVKTGEVLGKQHGIYTMSQVSHNWSWQIASNNRIITEGLLMYDTTNGALDLMAGRLANSVSGGYIAPTKPLIADGRLILRMPDKLVCYDLRMHPEAEKTEVIKLSAKGAAVAGPNAFDVDIRIRKRGDELISLGGKAPDITSSDLRKAISWGPQDWSQVSWYRTVIPHKLTLTDTSLKGSAPVRLGYQYEPFSFDLKREGTSFEGTYTRSVKAFEHPIQAAGDVFGPIVTKEDGSRYFYLYMVNAGLAVGPLRAGEKPNASVGIILSVDKDDNVTAAGMAAGRVCRMSHEVDIQEVDVKGNAIKGKVTVIIHDDKYGDFDFEQSKRELRTVGEGGAVAYQYSFESNGIEKKDDKTGETKLENKGKFTGTLGVAWSKTGTISGKLEKE